MAEDDIRARMRAGAGLPSEGEATKKRFAGEPIVEPKGAAWLVRFPDGSEQTHDALDKATGAVNGYRAKMQMRAGAGIGTQ